jgi:hypothetical protein
LTYLDGAKLESAHRWPLLLGDPANNVKPSDPLMIESIGPRSGVSPLTNAALVSATSTDPTANPDNGHELNVPDLDDLQYACTFALATPEACAPGDATCACAAFKDADTSAITAANSPLCQPPAGGPPGTTQYYAKGNPGTRELTVARDLGSRATPASICPRYPNAANAAYYGYVPALDSLVSRLSVTLK